MTEGLRARIRVDRSPTFSLDIELAIAPGETVALLGHNGAGKSTTVEAIAGLARVSAGQIAVNGRVLDDGGNIFVSPAQRKVGVVFQDYLLFDHLSVQENLGFGATEAKATRVAEQLGISDLLSMSPRQLSGGQQQRVALGRALAIEPDLLLLDEPLAALDVETRTATRRTLAEHLRQFQGPKLLITHDPADAFLLADRIYMMENGRITQSGTAEEIRQKPATSYAAAVAGTNLLHGTNDNGTLTLADHPHTLQTSDVQMAGDVLITIHPRAVSLHPAQPHGSPRNTWLTTVAAVEPLGDTTRILLAAPLPISVDITPASTASLGLAPGVQIWASVKATEIRASPTGER